MADALTRRSAMAGLVAAGMVPARAQQPHAKWPERGVVLVHGHQPAADTDAIARTVAEGLRRRLGQSVLVDQRSGSGGRLAAAHVARAAPDGHTLMVLSSGYAVTAALYKTLPYRPVDDFDMISMLAEYPLLLVTSAESEVHSLADLVELARSRASRLLYGSAGNGSLQHLAGELLSRQLNITFQHVPYRGPVQAINDLIARRIDFIVDLPVLEMPFIRAGWVRPLMVTSAVRFFALPQVPTAAEADLPGFSFTAWHGLAGPAGMPAGLVDRIATEVAAVLMDSDVVERMRIIGNDPAPTLSGEFRARLVADIDKWLDVVESARLERI